MRQRHHYVVQYVITVDRPELRGPTFLTTVRPGTRIPQAAEYLTLAAARARYDDLKDGIDDFTSEYVSVIDGIRREPSASAATRWVRGAPTIRRRRIKDGTVHEPHPCPRCQGETWEPTDINCLACQALARGSHA
jgi:hypothetical protein